MVEKFRRLRVVDELDMLESGFDLARIHDDGDFRKTEGKDMIRAFQKFDKKLERLVREFKKQYC
jgi:hypothetical protein